MAAEIRALKNGRFGLFEGEAFLFSIDADLLAENRLHTGDTVEQPLLEALRKTAAERRAKDRAFNILAYRDHSREELRRKLQRNADDETAEKTIEKMEELGLIDDEAYAEKLARMLMQAKGYGRIRVIGELLRRGIGRELAEEMAERFDGDPAERAFMLLKKKYPRGISGEAGRRKAAAMLSRNGYAWDEIRKALSDCGTEEQDAD